MMPQLKIRVVLHHEADRRRYLLVYLRHDELGPEFGKDRTQDPIIVAIDVQAEDTEIFFDFVGTEQRHDVIGRGPIATGENFLEVFVGLRQIYKFPAIELDAEASPALEETELHLRDAVASLRRARLAIGEAKTAPTLDRCR